ncbi:MAG: hypothetical protein HQL17_08460, partial [Candidatus Omnitrophica bacterium]|nr:hypothetical protein [Candidatus Omnitrophota bacterium]
EKMFENRQVSTEKIQYSVMTFPFIVEALGAGTIDASVLLEPFVSIAQKKDIELEFIPFVRHFPNAQASFIVFGAHLIEKDKALGVRFMNAYLKGARQLAQGKTSRNIEILAKALGQNEKLLEHMIWPVYKPENMMARKDLLKDYQDWLVRKKFLPVAIDVGNLFDTYFLDKAVKE